MASEFEVYDKQKAAYEKQFDYDSRANDFLAKTGTTVKIKFYEYEKHFADDKENRNRYHVTIKRNGITWSYLFGDSIFNTVNGIEPTAYDVLACVEKYDVGTFHDFCNEFGYDEYDDYGRENTKARRIYKAVRREAEKVNELFGDVLEEFCEVFQ